MVCDGFVERVVAVRSSNKGLHREQDRTDLKSRRPLILQNIKTDPSKLVNVGMIDLGAEEHLRWHHRILIRQEKFSVEHSTGEGSLFWSRNFHEEVARVVGIRLRIDTNDGLGSETLRLLHNSWVRHFSITNHLTNF